MNSSLRPFFSYRRFKWRKHAHLVLVNSLGSLPRNSVARLTGRLDMTIIVDWDVKPQIKQTNKLNLNMHSDSDFSINNKCI